MVLVFIASEVGVLTRCCRLPDVDWTGASSRCRVSDESAAWFPTGAGWARWESAWLQTSDAWHGSCIPDFAMTTIYAKSLLAIRSTLLQRNAVFAKASAPASAPPSGCFGDVLNH